MAATYTPIASITLGATASTVTFSSIPQTYTDLVLIVNGGLTSGSTDLRLRFNSDSGTNYSRTGVYGDGSSVVAYRSSSSDNIITPQFASTVSGSMAIMNLLNYSNANVYKNVLLRSGYATGLLFSQVGMWRNTAAITNIECGTTASTTWVSGSTFNLYGILGANT